MNAHFLKASSLLVTSSIILLSFLSSCKKDEEQSPISTEVKPACKPTKSYNPNDPSTYWLSEYDQKDNLLKQTFVDKGTEHIIISYKRNEKGQVIETVQETKPWPGSTASSYFTTYAFEYNDKGQVAKFRDKYSESLCEYDGQGNRIKITETYPNTSETRVLTFEYKNGNCVKSVYPTMAPSEVTYEYEYYLDKENKMASFERVNGYLLGQSPNKNMLKKTTVTEKTPSGTTIRSTQYTYEYNDKGFAVKSTSNATNNSGGTTYLYTNEYICQ